MAEGTARRRRVFAFTCFGEATFVDYDHDDCRLNADDHVGFSFVRFCCRCWKARLHHYDASTILLVARRAHRYRYGQ